MMPNKHNQYMRLHDHHAYLIEGETEQTLAALHLFLEGALEQSIADHPDIFRHSFDALTMDDARLIKELDLKTPFVSEKKYIIISFNSINREAQNALLKVFEEPSSTSRFFLLTPSASLLLPTLLSRLEQVRHESFGKLSSALDPKKFLALSKAKRLEKVSELLKEISDGIRPKRDAQTFLHAVVRQLEQEVVATKTDTKSLVRALEAAGFADDKSASLKLLLERVALC